MAAVAFLFALGTLVGCGDRDASKAKEQEAWKVACSLDTAAGYGVFGPNGGWPLAVHEVHMVCRILTSLPMAESADFK